MVHGAVSTQAVKTQTESSTKKKSETRVNPLSPSIHIQILQTDLYTFP